MNTQSLLIVLLVVAVVFGLGVVLVNRRRGSAVVQVEVVEVETPMAPALEESDTPSVLEEVVVEPPLAGPPTFRERMGKAAAVMAGAIGGIRARGGISVETWDDLEEALLRADLGLGVTTDLLDSLRDRVRTKELSSPDDVIEALRVEMKSRLSSSHRDLQFDTGLASLGLVNVWLVVGVNGVGKTTTIGKISAQQVGAGRSVVLGAGDTFRAAAAEQLGTWAERSGAELVRGAEGGDPSSVIFDAVQRAAARGADLVIGDTAGRLQNKSNLMDELRKVRRVADREPGRVTEVLLVVDATTGQNGLSQAREFADAAGVTGVVLTKLDGSAKGGIVFAIETELGIPVKLVGLGETIVDLVVFDPDQFVDALFDR
jgi:fused signal recognition particle receptor